MLPLDPARILWVWLYTFWYQIKPFSTSDNADALVWGLMMLLTVVFIFVPFIPWSAFSAQASRRAQTHLEEVTRSIGQRLS